MNAVQSSRRPQEQRRLTIRALWLACHTREETAEAVGISEAAVSEEWKVASELEALPKLTKLAALHDDADWARRPQEARRGTRQGGSIARLQGDREARRGLQADHP